MNQQPTTTNQPHKNQQPATPNRPLKILFVCLGNICRSPAAQSTLLHIISQNNDTPNWHIDSAATGNYHTGDLPDPRMRHHAAQRNLTLTHRARQIDIDDFTNFDIIIPMDANNHRHLLQLAPDPQTQTKIHPIATYLSPHLRQHYDHIPDPYYEGPQGFQLVLDLLQDACTNIYNTHKQHP